MAYVNIKKLSEPLIFKDDTTGIEIHTANGLLHRDGNLPAVISSNHHEYYVNGQLHRDNGPARMFLIAPDGSELCCEWWVINRSSGKSEYINKSIIDKEAFEFHLYKGEK